MVPVARGGSVVQAPLVLQLVLAPVLVLFPLVALWLLEPLHLAQTRSVLSSVSGAFSFNHNKCRCKKNLSQLSSGNTSTFWKGNGSDGTPADAVSALSQFNSKWLWNGTTVSKCVAVIFLMGLEAYQHQFGTPLNLNP